METKKITLNLSEENFNAVNEMSNKYHMNKTTVVNHAISLEKFIRDQIAQGYEVVLENKDKNEKKTVVIR